MRWIKPIKKVFIQANPIIFLWQIKRNDNTAQSVELHQSKMGYKIQQRIDSLQINVGYFVVLKNIKNEDCRQSVKIVFNWNEIYNADYCEHKPVSFSVPKINKKQSQRQREHNVQLVTANAQHKRYLR